MSTINSVAKRGFSLTELLLVVVIVALLMVLGLVNLKKQIDRSFDSKRKADIHQLKRAFEEYYNDHDCYPPLTILGECAGPQLQPYIKEVPCDPVRKLPYKYIAMDEVGLNLCKGFKLFASLADTGDPDIIALGCSPVAGCGYGTEWNYGVAVGGPLTASGFDPNLVPTPTPQPAPGRFACDPSGNCNAYGDPYGSGCPVTYDQDNCNNSCGNPANRCLK